MLGQLACKSAFRDLRAFLLGRFAADVSDWPRADAELQEEDDGSRFALLQVDSGARDLTGEFAPCRATMTLRIHRGRVCRVRAYAWYTEYDEEGLLADIAGLVAAYTPERIDSVVAEALRDVESRSPPAGGPR